MVSAVDVVEAGVEALAALVAAGGLDQVPTRVLGRVESRLRRLEQRQAAVRAALLPVVEAEGSWALDGSRTFGAWLARRDDISVGAANREVRAGRVLRDHLPATRAAALDGRIGTEHVAAMVAACSTDARTAALCGPAEGLPVRHDDQGRALPTPTGEGFLLDQARLCTLRGFQRLVRRFAHVADPDADERGYSRAAEREHLEVSATLGGWHLAGFLTEEHGQAVRTALDALTPAPAAGDDRTPTQRRAQALADLARACLDHGHTGAGAAVRPHLTVTVSWTELHHLLAADTGSHPTDRHSTVRHPDHLDCGGHAGRGGDIARGCGPRPGPGAGADGGAGRGGGYSDGSAGKVGRLATGCGGGGGSGYGGGGGHADHACADHACGCGGGGGHADRACADPACGCGDGQPNEVAALLALERTPAILEGSTGPLPDSVLRRLACDSEITRVVFGPDSQILNVGRAQRTIRGPLRRAVVARDRHCVWPGCEQPPSRCEVHHAQQHWADHGPTSTTNAALLCWHHHTLVDTTGVTMTWNPADPSGSNSTVSDPEASHPTRPRPAATRAPSAGHWTLTDRHGNPITTPSPWTTSTTDSTDSTDSTNATAA
ncbi:hypothetical protein GCM10007967_17750 [Xylanimonas ulmi]